MTSPLARRLAPTLLFSLASGWAHAQEPPADSPIVAPESPRAGADTDTAATHAAAQQALKGRVETASAALDKISADISELKTSGAISAEDAAALTAAVQAARQKLPTEMTPEAVEAGESAARGAEAQLNAVWSHSLRMRLKTSEKDVEKARQDVAQLGPAAPKTQTEQFLQHATHIEANLSEIKVLLGAGSRVNLTQAQGKLEKAQQSISTLAAELKSRQTATGSRLVDVLLEARCRTAFCFDNGGQKHWLGIEPLVELPLGKSFGVGRSSLAAYVNNHELRVDLAAGLRVWLFRDVVSVSVYISKALTDASVRIEGSPFVYSGGAVKRPYPGVALGLLYDSLWLGFDRDELHNGDTDDRASFNPDFPPNQVVSATWTITLALQPVTAFRSAIGTAVESSKKGTSE